MSNKAVFSLVTVLVIILLGAFTAFNLIGHNDDNNWQVIQRPGGEVSIRDKAGYYFKGFSTVTTYPRAFQMEWGPERVTFNDGGTATIDGTALIRTANTSEERILMHRDFSGDSTMRNAEFAVESHLTNSIKVTGPVMSGSEHQSARKGEFYSLVRAQFEKGLFQTEKIEVELKDQFDQSGRPITVYATRVIVGDDNKPVINEVSPLLQYNFEVGAFSIESTDYDAQTLELFAAKKQSLLNAERSKAEREEQVQERLMIVERGLKEKADIEAKANMEKARLTIEAETSVAVANQQALQAEEIKRRQETEASARREVAALDLEAARLNAEAIQVTAAAEEERIEKAGAITERDRVLAEIDRETRIGVAREISQITTPNVMFMGGSNSGGGNQLENLINVALMRQLGVITDEDLGSLPNDKE